MKGRTPNKEEKEHMQAMRQLGCIACIVKGRIAPYEVPEEYTAIHHIEGKTKPNAHMLTIGLCPDDHQYGECAVHGKKKKFIEQYGTEYELLDLAKELAYEQISPSGQN